MKTMSAREAKNAFGMMIDTACADTVRVEKHGRGVVVFVSVEEYERLSVQDGHTEKDTKGFGGVARRERIRSEIGDMAPEELTRAIARLLGFQRVGNRV